MKKTSLRITALTLVMAMLLLLGACGENKTEQPDKGRPSDSPSSSDVGTTENDTSSNTSGNVSNNASNNTSSAVTSVSDENRHYYKPTSLTVSFYDTATSIYGFTWNCEFEPVKPVIQVCEGSTFNASKCKEYTAAVKLEVIYNPGVSYMYVSKAQAPLKQNTVYTYRAYDKVAKIGSEPATIKTANFKATSFSFAHVSDSQVAADSSDTTHAATGTGKWFADTLTGIKAKNPNVDFLLHTGDVVEWSKYETYWKNMLDYNFKHLSVLPTMAISGNHETTYRNGRNELFKHFNVKLPEQLNTDIGYFYDFDYGNTKFIMLNTNRLDSSGLTTDQYNWLVSLLKNNKQKWTIVSMHNPMYSVGKYGADTTKNATALLLRKQLGKLFADYGVDLVLQGHDHAYSKTYAIAADGAADLNPTYETVDSVKYTVNPKGVIYSMHGPAGNQSRSPFLVDNNLYEFAVASKTNSWANIKVDSDRITVEIMYYNNGNPTVAYSYGIMKK